MDKNKPSPETLKNDFEGAGTSQKPISGELLLRYLNALKKAGRSAFQSTGDKVVYLDMSGGQS